MPPLTPEEGLPSATVYAIAQDSMGMLWLATEAGLCRYDGNRFERLSNPEGVSTAVDRPTLAGDGTLWCKNFSGQVFYQTGARLVPIQGRANERFLQITADPKGRVWVLSNLALYRYTPRQAQPAVYPIREFGAQLAEMLCDAQNIYLVAGNELWVAELEQPTRIRRRLPFTQGQILGLTQRPWQARSSTGELLVAGASGWQAAPGWQPAPSKRVVRVGSLPTGETAVATASGLWLQRPGTTGWEHLLPGLHVTHAFVDAEGTLWASTLYNGLHRLVRNGLRRYSVAELFRGREVHGLCAMPDGNLAVGLAQGKIVLLDSSLGSLRHWQLPSSEPVAHLVYAPAGRLLYAGHYRQPIDGNAAPTHYRTLTDTKDLALSTDWCVAATYRGIEATARVPKPSALPFYQAGIGPVTADFVSTTNRARAVAFSETGSLLYVGFETGLVVSDAQARTLVQLPDSNPVLASRLATLPGNRVAVGTFRQGLVVLQGTRVERQLTAAEGWVDLPCLALSAWGDTVVYATAAGVQLYSPKTGCSHSLGVADGLADSEIRALACTAAGVWVASGTHLTFVPYSAFGQPVVPWRVYLLGAQHNGLDTQLVSRAVLPSTTTSLALRYQTTSLRYAKPMQYAYRLLPTDTVWHPVPIGAAEVRLPQLKAGDYQLEVQARAAGVPGLAALHRVEFSIRAPLWQRWYTWLGVLLVSVGSGVGLYRRRTRYLAQVADQERRVRLAQLSALRAQMNPHFLFNALNTLQDAILQADTQRAAQLLQYFSKLLRHVVDHAPQQTLPLNEELKLLQLYIELQKARFAGEVTVTLTLDLPPGADQQQVPAMFILPFVENGFEHGLRHKREGPKSLALSFRIAPSGTLHCCIEDTGIGRAAAGALRQTLNLQHTSVGLISTHERIRLFNEMHPLPIVCTITDLERPTGTRVDLMLPLQ
ncbi:MAG: histidine kinase [Bacteroidia bacterium]|nr:histidine kinase [Bacteroidia bacterium]